MRAAGTDALPPLDATRHWIKAAVIGLDLCPFARAVYDGGRIRYVLSAAETPEELLGDLVRELEILAEADPDEVETTLIVHPQVLDDFLDYNDFLGVAEAAVEDLELDGVIQVASFHPRYRFEGTPEDDPGNFTNRSPHPTLHLLREESVERAVAAFPDASRIYEKNIATLRHLGLEGWNRLKIAEKP